jgi:hypothetical protein
MRRAMVPSSSLEDGNETGPATLMRNLNPQQQQQQKHPRQQRDSCGKSTKQCLMPQLSPFLYLILSFACGYYVGTYNGRISQKTTTIKAVLDQKKRRRASQIIRLDNVPLTSTSHVDNAHGRSITKQQLIEPFVLAHNLAGISVTSLLPGQTVYRHVHESMQEFFYILDGQGLVQLDDNDMTEQEETTRGIPKNSRNTSVESSTLSWRSVSKGCLVYAAAREAHAFHVPENASQSMQMIFFGLTTTNNPT